ncbi:Rieske 2Fe-2S domain-containing protein [Mangrovicoccus ximenensis]|uniref:Rieske 2Fe-2S domain-containing protein n=1 Tax=Mangrovicoccus ximenensis TaxID=1911570 RepID=UPI000D3C6839|nr:Rieske 2Fe-2S domain-containing protein [Mangrovicoccus ximenensis]
MSDGRVVGGQLECLYHGWCFEPSGRCSAIPQLLPERSYPPRADVRAFPLEVVQGVVWIWPGDPERADPALVPRAPELEAAGIHCVTFQIDLPYDQGYLIENAIDIAHVHVAHHGLRGGGHRSMAKPILFETEDHGAAGFASAFRSVGASRAGAAPVERAEVAFVAPQMLRYRTRYRDAARISGLDLIAVPLGPGRCRLLYRKFSNFNPPRERLKPRWMEHLTQCAILEQDMALVIGQHAETEASGLPLRTLWMPLNTSDPTVIAYRRWAGRHGRHIPGLRGYDEAAAAPAPAAQDCSRAALHLPNCPSSGRAAASGGKLHRPVPGGGGPGPRAALPVPACLAAAFRRRRPAGSRGCPAGDGTLSCISALHRPPLFLPRTGRLRGHGWTACVSVPRRQQQHPPPGRFPVPGLASMMARRWRSMAMQFVSGVWFARRLPPRGTPRTGAPRQVQRAPRSFRPSAPEPQENFSGQGCAAIQLRPILPGCRSAPCHGGGGTGPGAGFRAVTGSIFRTGPCGDPAGV